MLQGHLLVGIVALEQYLLHEVDFVTLLVNFARLIKVALVLCSILLHLFSIQVLVIGVIDGEIGIPQRGSI